jgi:hypothetical protein
LLTASSDNLSETRSGDEDDDKSQEDGLVFLSPSRKHTTRISSCSPKTIDTVDSPLKDNPFRSLSEDDHEAPEDEKSANSSSTDVTDNLGKTQPPSYGPKKKTTCPQTPKDIYAEINQLDSQLKEFKAPTFSPEVAAQVTAAAAVGKERNKLKRMEIRAEMGIPTSPPSSPAILSNTETVEQSQGLETFTAHTAAPSQIPPTPSTPTHLPPLS